MNSCRSGEDSAGPLPDGRGSGGGFDQLGRSLTVAAPIVAPVVWSIAFLCLLALGTHSFAAIQKTRTFEELAGSATEARQSERTADAIRLYQQALALKAEWIEGWWYLGNLLYEVERYGESRDAFRRLVGLEPDGGPAWAFLGLAEFQLGKYQEALEALKKARTLGVGPNKQLSSLADYHAGVLLTRFGDYEAAAKILHALASESGGQPRILEALGLSMLALPLLPHDLSNKERALAVEVGRAGYYITTRRLDDARNVFQELLERYPEEPNVHYNYGLFLLIVHNPDGALEKFKKVLELSSLHVSARLQIVFEFLRRNDYQAALPFAEEALSLAPRSAEANSHLGRILFELGQVERAVNHLEKGAELAPDDHKVRYVLSRAYSRLGRKEDAERARREFLRLEKLHQAHQVRP